jgi:4-amino-4-deoxy-L-arabinose transferase-like glycosyltransferase
MVSSYSARLAVFAIALAIRLVAIEATGANRVVFGDGPDYIAYAQSLCVQHQYPERGNLPFFRAPGLPFFIAAVTACHPTAVRAIKYSLAVCDALTCVVIASIALLLFGRVAAWLAGLIGCIHPVFVASVCDVRSEPLFMLLLTLSIWLLLRRWEAWAGVAVALAALTRPSALLCIPLFALYRPRRAAALLVAAAVTLAPWAIRNFMRYHELILVNDASGFSVWRGSHPETIAIAHERDRNAYRERAMRFETRTIAATAREIDAVARTPASRSREWFRRGVASMRGEFLFVAEKAWLYWRPWLNPMEYSRLITGLSALFFITLYALGAIGLMHYEKRTVVLTFFVVIWLAHLPFQISMRLRVPFTDPLLIVFAASALIKLNDLLVQLRADGALRLERAATDVRGEDQARIVGEAAGRRLGIEDVERQAGQVL